MQDLPDTPREQDLDRVQERARRLARDARDFADQSRPAAATGERPELVPQASPAVDLRGSDAIHRAEQARAADDLETAERQQELAAGQQDTAEALRRNADALSASRAALQNTGDQIARNAERADEVADTVEALDEQVDRLRDQARGPG